MRKNEHPVNPMQPPFRIVLQSIGSEGLPPQGRSPEEQQASPSSDAIDPPFSLDHQELGESKIVEGDPGK
jgi:hypothetical protein